MTFNIYYYNKRATDGIRTRDLCTTNVVYLQRSSN